MNKTDGPAALRRIQQRYTTTPEMRQILDECAGAWQAERAQATADRAALEAARAQLKASLDEWASEARSEGARARAMELERDADRDALAQARALLAEARDLLISEQPVSIYSAVSEASRKASLSDVAWWGLCLSVGELCKRIAAANPAPAEKEVRQ